MNPQLNRQSAIKIVSDMASLTAEPRPKKVSPDESDVTETPLEKSGAIRQEFIRVVWLTRWNASAQACVLALWFPNRIHRTCSENDSYYAHDGRPAKRFRPEPLWAIHDSPSTGAPA
jgi:hypothetical protein